MKREFEFRVWDNDDKKYMTLDDYEKMGCVMLNNDGTLYLSSDYRFVLNMMIKLDKYVVEQYTGLKDKNGVKIFEGDIVKYPDGVPYTVMFDPTGYWCLDGNGIRNSEMLIQDDDTNNYIEVIGNIHEDNKGSESNVNTTN